MSRYALLLLACAVLSGVGYFRGWRSNVEQPMALSTAAQPVSEQSASALPGAVADAQSPYEQANRGSIPVARPTETQLKAVEEVAGKNWLSQALKGIEESEYHIRWNAEKGAYSSPNRRQNLRFTYNAKGFEMTPRVEGGAWTAGVEVRSVAGVKPSANAAFESKENTLLAHHGGFSVEFVNNEAGMRQNFILPQRPAGSKDQVEVRLSPVGNLTASQSGFNEIAFINPQGQAKAYYKDLKVWDASGRTLSSEMNLSGGEIVLAVNIAGAQFPVTIDPISCTPNWQNNQGGLFNQADMQFGYSVAVAGQQTGALNHRSFATANAAAATPDFSDIIVGAPNYDNTGLDQGAVFVYYGQAAGPSANPDWQMLGIQNLSLFGYSVASAGNVYNHTAAEAAAITGANPRPGIADLIVGAPRWSLTGANSNEGRVFMWYGTSTGISTTPLTSGADWSTSNIGRTSSPGAQLGFSVAGAGEVYIGNCQIAGVAPQAAPIAAGNSNLAGEIVVGAPFFTGVNAQHGTAAQFGGAAVVFFGNNTFDAVTNRGVWPLTGGGEAGNQSEVFVATTDHGAGTTFPFFGWSVARSGDLSSDGIVASDLLNEILVGSPGYETSAAETDEGAAYIVFSNDGSSKHINATGNVAAAPFAATNPIQPGGRLEVSKGTAPTRNYQVVEGQQAGGQLGYAIAGDFQVNDNTNSQVLRDIVVGAPLAERMVSLSEEGWAIVFNGLANTLGGPATPTFYISHVQATDAVNNNVRTKSNGTSLWGGQQGARFGWSVAGSGDMDGNRQTAVATGANAPAAHRSNGFGEVIIGAPYAEGPVTPQLDEGVSYVYYGSAEGVNVNDRCILEGNRTNMQFGYSVAGTPGLSNTTGGFGGINSSSLQNDVFPGSLAGRVQLADIVIGAPGYDNTENSISDRNQGRAYAFYGVIRPTVVFNPTAAPFCPNSAPVVRADVFDMVAGQQFTITYLEGSTTRTANYTFTPIAGTNPSRMQITIPTSVQQVTTIYTLQYLDLPSCCRHILTGTYTATASAPSLANFRTTDATLCLNQVPALFFNLTGGATTGDQIRLVWSASTNGATGPWVRQPDFLHTATTNAAGVQNNIQITNAVAPTMNTTYRVDSIINVTRNCGTAIIGQTVAVTVTQVPTVSITIDPYCPGTVPVIRGTVTGLANDNIRWRISGRVNDPISGGMWSISGRGNFPTPTLFTEVVGDPTGVAFGIEAETNASIAVPGSGNYTAVQLNNNPNRVGLLIGSEMTDPTFLDNVLTTHTGNLTLYIDAITVINTPQLNNTPWYTQTATRQAGGFAVATAAYDATTGLGNPPTVQVDNCVYSAPLATLPRMFQGFAMNQLPEVQFDPSPIFFCSGTTPTVRVRVTNVAVGQPWTIGWKEAGVPNFLIPPVAGDPELLLFSGVGPGLFNLSDTDVTSAISPGVGPTVRNFDTIYRLGWIAAGGCTTTYGQISQNIVNAIATGTTTPTVQFQPVPTFCAGNRPTVQFNVLNVPANESYTFSGYYNRYFRSANGTILTETRAFNSLTYTGSSPAGSPFNFDRIVIGADTMMLPTLAQNDSIEFFFTRYRNVNALLCDVNLVSVSTGVAPTQGVTVNINAIANFCPGSQPNVTVEIPAGNWTITYRESSTQFGNIDRTVGINAPVSGAYALTTSPLSTNATYTLIGVTRTPQPAGECMVMLGASRTAFVSQNALPSAMFTQPAFFCAGSVPQLRVEVQNVPFTLATAVTNRWRIGWREGNANAAIQYTAYQTGGATVNYLLPNSNPQSANTMYFIAVIEVEGQCSRTYNNSIGEGAITAIARPTPSVRFVNAPISVCSGARPFIAVEVSGIAPGNPYELNWEEGGAMRTLTGFSTGNPFVVGLNLQNNISTTTQYRLVSLFDRSTNCGATLNPALTTVNVAVDNFATPTALFTAVNYNYCSTTLPVLAINVGNIADPTQSWTVTYREEPNGPAQTVSGIGAVNNFEFTPSIAPSASVVTYRILSIRNDVTGCQSNIANSATATRTLNAGVVSLDPVSTTCTNSAPNFTVRVPGIAATQSWVLNWVENGNFRSTFGLGSVFTLPINDLTLYSTAGTRTVQLLSIVVSTQTGNPQCNPSVDQTIRSFQVISGAPAASFSPMNVTAVCSGTVPVVNVNISPAAAYTLRYRVNDSAVPSSISGFGSLANIGGTVGINAQTKYSLVDITAGGCSQDLGEVAFVVNVNSNPTVAFASAAYTYCAGGNPTLSLNVSNITNINDSWTVTYRQSPAGATQTVSGTGNTSNFSFVTSMMATTSPANYEIISIRNNTTGCTGVSASTATATSSATGGVVTLNPIANICAGNTPAVTVNVPGVVGTQNWTLMWSENGEARTTVGVGPAFGLPMTPALYANAGTRTISLTGISIPGATCQPSMGAPVSFQVLSSPMAMFAAGNAMTLCAGSVPTVNVTITPAGTGTLSYRVNGGAVQQVAYNGSQVNIGGANPVTGNTTWELVSVSDGTCSRPLTGTTFMLTVTPGINPTILSMVQPTGCSGNGSITVRGAQGVSGLSYSIRNNTTNVQTAFEVSNSDQFMYSNLNGGSYTLFVRSATGCEASIGPVNLTATGPLTPTLLSVTPINDNTVQVGFTSVSGGSPYILRYRALPNGAFLNQTINNSNTGTITTTVGNLQPGLTYEFSVASACASTTFSNVLTFGTQSACLTNPLLAVPTGVTVNTQIIGSIAKIATVGWNKVAGATGYVVRWRVSGGNPNYSNIVRCDAQISDDPNNGSRKLFTIPGSFLVGVTYEVQIAAQCQSCGVAPNVAGTSNFTATVTFRIEDGATAANGFNVYPNPNDGQFTVSFTAAEASDVNVTIFDLAGRSVLNRSFTAQLGENSLPINLEGVAAGVYTLRFVQNGVVRTTKLVLN